MHRPFFALIVCCAFSSACFAQQQVAINLCAYLNSTDYCAFGDGITSLLQAEDGNFYGTTSGGGANNAGTVFRASPLGTIEDLHDFCAQTSCTDGSTPNSLVQSTDGNFYGTTQIGGTLKDGTIFRISPSGAFSVIHNFCTSENCEDGYDPQGGLIEGSDGKLYGTSEDSVFSITTGGILTAIGDFTPYTAQGSLLQTSDGTFYGTSVVILDDGSGNQYGVANLISFTTSGNFTSSDFCCSGAPTGNLVEAANGQIYGSTDLEFEGISFGSSVLYSVQGTTVTTATGGEGFTSPIALADGNLLTSEFDPSGDNLYPLLEVSPSGGLTTLANATPATTGIPLVLGGDGNIYIPSEDEIVILTPISPLKPGVVVTASKTSLMPGQSTTVQWSVNNGFSATMARCEAFLNGAPQGLVPLHGSHVFTPTTVGSYVVGITCGGTESGTVTIDVSNGQALNTSTAVVLPSVPVLPYSTVVMSAVVTRSSGIGHPTGVVSFYTGSQLLGSAALLDGTASIPVYPFNFSPSNVPIVVKFSGDSLDNASASATSDLVVYVPTTTTLTATPKVVEAGQTVTLSAKVYADNFTCSAGIVKFYYGAMLLGQASVVNNVASLTASTSGVPSGIYPITAVYEGTQNFSASNAGAVDVTVDNQ